MRAGWQTLTALSLALGLSCADDPDARRPRGGHWLSLPEERPVVEKPKAPVALVPLETCGESEEGFAGWLESFRAFALAQGISSKTIGAALADVAYDPEVVQLDRSQKAFNATFEEFYAAHVTKKRLEQAKERVQSLAPLLTKIEEKYGVAPEVLVAIWGLETDFGKNIGTRSSVRSLSTLAYDCRRAARFRAELLSALRILERGDLSAFDMVGAWAGEIGQTQFMPSSYERFAVDFDGDGRADLLGSSADALASTASYLQGHGWVKGEDWKPGSTNDKALAEWNASGLYRRTIATFAAKLVKKRRGG